MPGYAMLWNPLTWVRKCLTRRCQIDGWVYCIDITCCLMFESDWLTGCRQRSVPVHTDQSSGGSCWTPCDITTPDVTTTQPATCSWCQRYIQTSWKGGYIKQPYIYIIDIRVVFMYSSNFRQCISKKYQWPFKASANYFLFRTVLTENLR